MGWGEREHTRGWLGDGGTEGLAGVGGEKGGVGVGWVARTWQNGSRRQGGNKES